MRHLIPSIIKTIQLAEYFIQPTASGSISNNTRYSNYSFAVYFLKLKNPIQRPGSRHSVRSWDLLAYRHPLTLPT